jgi:hypothetical protein
MNLCHRRNSKFLVFFLGLFLFSIPAFCQRATLGVDVGQTTDKYGSLSSTSALEGIINGQVTILPGSGKQGEPSIVAGGEVRVPENSNEHPREFAVFGGPEFHFGNFVLGLHAQVRKIYQPSSEVGSLFFIRNNMLMLELPVVAQYKFGASHRAFIRAEGISEFNPRYRNSSNGTETFANPKLDHGYSLRGSLGYDFPRWYLKASYETRYFKFSPNFGNPDGLDNWRSDLVTGGVGFVW